MTRDGIRDLEWSISVQFAVAASTRDSARLRAVGKAMADTPHRRELVWLYLVVIARFAMLDRSSASILSRDDVLEVGRDICPCWAPNGRGDLSLLEDILLVAMELKEPRPDVLDGAAFIALAVGCLVAQPETAVDGYRAKVAAFCSERHVT